MRKLVAWLLLLSALFSFSAQAEKESFVLYTHPSLGYSFELPQDWTVLDESNLTAEKDALDFALTDKEETAVLQAGLAVFLSPDGYRLTVARESLVMPMTAEMFMSMMMPYKQTEMEETIEGIIFPDHPSVYYTEDDRAFCYLTAVYPIDGVPHTLTRCFFPENTSASMYVLSYMVPLDLSQEEAEDQAYDFKRLTRAMMDTFFTAP